VKRPTVALAVLAASSAAHAAPDDLVTRPLVLDPGQLVARVAVELGISTGRYLRPLSIAPDAWVGVTPRLTVGLIHSNASIDQVAAGGSLCFRGDALSCDHVYRGSGLDVRWGLRDGAVTVVPRARLLVRDIGPWKPAATLGALVRWTQGRIAITGDPYLRLGLANLDRGNRAALVLPIWLGIQPGAGVLVSLHTGWDSELATWRDGWHVPLALELVARANEHLDLGITAGFRQLIGPQNNVKDSAAAVTVEYRP
jgi:hypothetical protein